MNAKLVFNDLDQNPAELPTFESSFNSNCQLSTTLKLSNNFVSNARWIDIWDTLADFLGNFKRKKRNDYEIFITIGTSLGSYNLTQRSVLPLYFWIACKNG